MYGKTDPIDFGVSIVGKNANSLTLWTSRGVSLLAKIVGTVRAWRVMENLVEFYFDRKAENTTPVPHSDNDKVRATPAAYLDALKAIIAVEEEKARLLNENAALEAQALLDAPKLDYADRSIATNGSMTMKAFAYLLLGKVENREISDQYVFAALRKVGLLGDGVNATSRNMPIKSSSTSIAMFEYKNPDLSDMSKEEIARRLARNPRFNGACTHVKKEYITLLLELFTDYFIDAIGSTGVKSIENLPLVLPDGFKEKVKRVKALTKV